MDEREGEREREKQRERESARRTGGEGGGHAAPLSAQGPYSTVPDQTAHILKHAPKPPAANSQRDARCAQRRVAKLTHHFTARRRISCENVVVCFTGPREIFESEFIKKNAFIN